MIAACAAGDVEVSLSPPGQQPPGEVPRVEEVVRVNERTARRFATRGGGGGVNQDVGTTEDSDVSTRSTDDAKLLARAHAVWALTQRQFEPPRTIEGADGGRSGRHGAWSTARGIRGRGCSTPR